jgi:hypothetical protein
MKKEHFHGLLLLIGLLGVSFRLPSAEPLTQAERKFAIGYFRQTRERLLKDLKGLTEAQLNYKPDSTRWSVAQCVEHIAISESLIWQWIQGTMQQPATPEKRAEVKITTPAMINAVTDRSHKMQAPEFLQPDGKFSGEEAALAAFLSRRDSTIAYFDTTKAALKDHFITHPVFGTVDCYQGLLMLAAHSERHTRQLEEVMASPGFPTPLGSR